MFGWKKGTAVLSAIALSISLLTGCGSTDNASGNNANAGASNGNGGDAAKTTAAPGTDAAAKPSEFQFYFTGSQNVKDLWDALKPMFEEKNPDVTVKLVYIPSGTGAEPTYDRILAAKQAGTGAGGIDLYEDGLPVVTKGGKDDVWETLQTDQIPNLANVDAQTMSDVSNLAIPYRSSAVVLAYNSEKVPTPPKTLDEVFAWIKNNPERFAYNDPATGGAGSSFVTTAIYASLPEDAIHSSDPAIMKDWDPGFTMLKELGKSMYGKGIYPKKNQGTLDLLANGEVDMIPAWSDMALEQLDKDQLPASTKLSQITPGFNGGPTYLMVNKLSENKEAVYKFLDFVLSPEAQSVIVEKMHGFPGVKLSSMPQDIQDQFKGVSEGSRSFNIGDLGTEINKRWQSEVAAQ